MDAALKPFLPDYDMRRDIPMPEAPLPLTESERDKEREQYIKARAPHIARDWMFRMDKLHQAFNETPLLPMALFAALGAKDYAEVGRLMADALRPAMRQLAETAAADEAYTILPEVK